jgi:hypothetical protein
VSASGGKPPADLTGFERTGVPSDLDYHDLCLQELADSEVELYERIASLEADLRAYRELAFLAISTLHDVAAEREGVRAQLSCLRDEYRGSAQTMLETKARDRHGPRDRDRHKDRHRNRNSRSFKGTAPVPAQGPGIVPETETETETGTGEGRATESDVWT